MPENTVPTKKLKVPSIKTMEKWMNDGVAKATDGCRVEPDGHCEHGKPSWLLRLGLILMPKDFVQIARDPFARQDTVRRTVETHSGTCAWCGTRRKSGKLFEYGTWSDGGRLSWHRGLFCSSGGINRQYVNSGHARNQHAMSGRTS